MFLWQSAYVGFNKIRGGRMTRSADDQVEINYGAGGIDIDIYIYIYR